MTIEQRIGRMKNSNEFFYNEDIALCIRSLEALQKIKRIIDINNSVLQEDVIKYKMICEVVNEALEEVTQN